MERRQSDRRTGGGETEGIKMRWQELKAEGEKNAKPRQYDTLSATLMCGRATAAPPLTSLFVL